VSQSKEGGYGLAGLLDVIRMTDKVITLLYLPVFSWSHMKTVTYRQL
jgi:hypothetical protein